MLAQVLFREGDVRAARRETDQALELAPDDLMGSGPLGRSLRPGRTARHGRR